MRLAWFTPWPPQPSGIAGCSADLVRGLAARGHAISVFVDNRRLPQLPRADDAPVAPGHVRVQSAHDFVWRHAQNQFDLTVYQLGNSRLHDFIWPYLFRFPGMAVLHDARLHHARARTLLWPQRQQDYRDEFRWSHPDTPDEAAELAVRGFDGPYYYLWPMVGGIVSASRLVAVHSPGAARDLADTYPDRPIVHLPLGHGSDAPPVEAERQQTRAALGFAPDAVIFGVFGGLTPDKRVEPILRTFARTLRHHPFVRLVLAGAADHQLDIRQLTETLGIAQGVTHLEALDDHAFDRILAAVDVSVNLRWPTALETSGPWLRALAAGRATVILDLAHQAHVPALDPRNWRPTGAEVGEPVTIALDILDEEHSLGLALDRLATDAQLRAALGSAGRRYWEAHHTVAGMVESCEEVMQMAVAAPLPSPAIPEALRADPWRHARELAAPFGDLSCELP